MLFMWVCIVFLNVNGCLERFKKKIFVFRNSLAVGVMHSVWAVKGVPLFVVIYVSFVMCFHGNIQIIFV